MRNTVSSIEENSTTDSEEGNTILVSSQDSGIKAGSIDIPGHFNFRSRIAETIETAKVIILVVDSKDR